MCIRDRVRAAQSFVHSNAAKFGISPLIFDKKDIHIHVPEGATPKDGPSAGVAMCTSIVSSLTGIAIRKDIAMTGEITLRGRVLPIGGLKEKILAAVRGGIKCVLIPKENEKDFTEIKEKELLENIEVIFVDNAHDVLEKALVSKLNPIEWNEKEISIGKDVAPSKESTIRH